MIDFEGKILVLAGPTASGKSNMAINLAKVINGYIINADSRQVYRELNIGTAKPKFEKKISEGIHILNGVKHYLFDFVNPKDSFTLFNYQQMVKEILLKEKKVPILVGGTGLYIDSVIFNYNLSKNDIYTPDLKEKNIKELQHIAKDYLLNMNESDRNNRHRLIRTIQRGGVNRKRGKELNNRYFVIDIDGEILRKRVRERIEGMFEEGLLEENKALLKNGYTYEDRGMNSIGYIEFRDYFENGITIEDVKESIFKNTMSYIKRQRTWFRRNKDCIWTNNLETIYKEASNFVLKE